LAEASANGDTQMALGFLTTQTREITVTKALNSRELRALTKLLRLEFLHVAQFFIAGDL